MLTTRFLISGLCLTSVFPANSTPADDRVGPYIGLTLAPQFFSDNKAGEVTVDFDTGFAISALIGYKLSNLRLEGELTYETAEGTSTTGVNADVDIVRLAGSAYYDFDLTLLKPYFGAGLGAASLEANGDFEDEDSAFTWHGEVGVSIPLTEQLSFLPAYRYEWTDTDLGTFSKPQTAHAFRVTLRYQFQPTSSGSGRSDYRQQYDTRPSYPYEPSRSYDPYYYPVYPALPPVKKSEPNKTPEQRERDRCGWQGPGCPTDKQNWQN